ncbi:hypothetical protein BTH41_02877 [Bacillus mycoides]|nr:hypothetical protein BTH41_02877 [Bacillus mycoides]
MLGNLQLATEMGKKARGNELNHFFQKLTVKSGLCYLIN